MRRAITRHHLAVQCAGIFVLGFVLSLSAVGAVRARGLALDAFGEPHKYTGIADAIVQHGMYGVQDEESGVYNPTVSRLPAFPLLVAAIYRVVGTGQYGAIALVQCVLFGITVVVIALSAAAVDRRWAVTAGLLACVWPNLLVRPATIMPETLFVAEISTFMCALLWLLRPRAAADRLWRSGLLTVAGLACGAALLTRPSFLATPFLVLPVMVLSLFRVQGVSLTDAVRWVGVVAIVAVTMLTPYYVRNRAVFGQFGLTGEGGVNAALWMYPCLSTPWGCGERNPDALARADQQVAVALARASASDRRNELARDRVLRDVGYHLLGDLRPMAALSAYAGGLLKLWFHSAAWEVGQRFALTGDTVPVGDIWRGGPSRWIQRAGPRGALWLIFAGGVLATRALQALAVAASWGDSRRRYSMIVLAVLAVAVTVTAVGLGNPRYRVPAEPPLVVLTVAGLDGLTRRWRAVRRARLATPSAPATVS